MEEIKVGEYVRTKNGAIFKIIDGNSDDYDIDISYYELGKIEDDSYSDLTMFNYNDNGNFIRGIIKKHSFNIIDLIEEGDYVNGDRMDIVEKDENGHTYYLQNCELPSVNLKDIKSIVTHEQFAQIEYKVKE